MSEPLDLKEVMGVLKLPELNFKTKEEKEKAARILNKVNEFVKNKNIKGAKDYLLYLKKNELSNATR